MVCHQLLSVGFYLSLVVCRLGHRASFPSHLQHALRRPRESLATGTPAQSRPETAAFVRSLPAASCSHCHCGNKSVRFRVTVSGMPAGKEDWPAIAGSQPFLECRCYGKTAVSTAVCSHRRIRRTCWCFSTPGSKLGRLLKQKIGTPINKSIIHQQ